MNATLKYTSRRNKDGSTYTIGRQRNDGFDSQV